MGKRLQVVISVDELAELRAVARRHGMTVSEWVRQAIRTAARNESTGDARRKLDAIRLAVDHAFPHAFPTGPIEELLEQSTRHYSYLPDQ